MRRSILVAVLALALPAPAQAMTFVVRGHGWGHGVGMSQWGARGLAEHGWGWRKILAHYYPGTSLSRVHKIEVRVLIATGRQRVAIRAKHTFRIVDARGRARLVRRHIVFAPNRLHRLRPPLRVVAGASPVALGRNGYRGELRLYRSGGTFVVVNRLPLERYLRGVVPWEMPSRWHPEALRAQAVAARTYALAERHPTASFDLFADTRDQVYGGIRAEHRSTNRAVGDTAGVIVTWRGRPAVTYYSSTSGGRTSSSHDAFHGPWVPYLRSVPDPYDAGPHHDWTYKFTSVQLGRKFGVRGVRAISVRRNESGRAAAIALLTRSGTRTIAGQRFESALGLPSTLFSIALAGRAAPTLHKPLRRGWVAILASSTTRMPRAVRSDTLPGLRPGLWVRVAGPFASRARAQAVASRRGGYVRRVG